MKSLLSTGLLRPLSAVSLTLFIMAPRLSAAATIRVPADFPTIQAAINASAHGDTVLVAPGIYPETIDFGGKIITVTSEQGPAVTVIDGGGTGTVVTFASGETRNAMLSGFTIRGGRTIYSGAGIYVASSSPTIVGNVITQNEGCSGTGIYSYFSSPRIEQNTITRNAVVGCSGAWGIGVYIGGNSAAEIIANAITENVGGSATGGGVALFAAGRAQVIGNDISRNSTADAGCGWGGGVAIANFAEAIIVNNLITGNRACVGGAFYWLASAGATYLENNTIADNDAQTAAGIYASRIDAGNHLYNNVIATRYGPALYCDNVSSPALDSNDVFNAVGAAYGGTCADQTGVAGNISADPLFDDAAAGDYRVGPASPLIDAGNNWAPNRQLTDIEWKPRIAGSSGGPDRIDIGAYEFFNRAPLVDAGPDQTVTAGSSCSAAVTVSGLAEDPDGDDLTFTWTGPAGTFSGPVWTLALPAGSHVLTLTVTDAKGESSSDSVTITVLDDVPPTISSVTATPNVLTRANHDMVRVAVAVSSSDVCGGTVSCRIVSVSSNEPVTGTGGGDVGPDWEITGDLTVNLRAERSNKGSGRIYTITVECTDVSGNRTRSTVTVSVPRR